MERTPEQIKNWRGVLRLMYGPFFDFIATDADINKIADNMQGHIDAMKVWKVKVKMHDAGVIPWSDIPDEPTNPCCTHEQIEGKCYSLLIKYPKIEAIRVENKEKPEEKYRFDRDH